MMQVDEAKAELDRFKQAMEIVGFFNGAQQNMFRLIAAILLLGNIRFKVVCEILIVVILLWNNI